MPKEKTETPKLDYIYCGDAFEQLATFADESIDCIVTSPPYFNQRNYDGEKQIGREKTPQQFVDALIRVFDQAGRVLRSTGTVWVVLGDKYDKAGRLLGTPWRFAIAMQDAGWILRSDIIWHKPNAMPSSTKTRPTTDHEYVFFFTKSKDYHYDADAIREPHVTFSKDSKMKGGRNHFNKRGGTPEKGKNSGNSNLHDARWDQAFHPNGRNKRTVWSIPLSKFREAHFAVFPEKLVETCIAAGCPEAGVVLDPFFGAGTTGVVAERLNRRYVGIDCNPDYCAIAARRIESASLPLLEQTGSSKD